MKRKRYKLKKNIRNILVLVIFAFILVFAFIKVIGNYKYKQTSEYKLTESGYTLDEAKLIIELLDEENVKKLTSENKNSTILLLLQNKSFKKENYQRYLDYLKKTKESVDNVVTIVNVNKDLSPYESSVNADTSKNETMLVNRHYMLNEDYEPNDLAIVSKKYTWGTTLLNKDAYDAFIRMWDEANKEGIYLMIRYGYISYIDQKSTYESYKKNNGIEKADDKVARPGSSDHQTGYGLDILELNHATLKTFNETDAYNWLLENSYLYGFIPRYPLGKGSITDYEESYHFRYVGENAAKIIHDENLTLEEYYAYY